MAKLSDKQRKQIIAEYLAGDGKVSHAQLANRYGVTRQAITKLLSDEESCQKLHEKKKENEMSMLSFLDDRSTKAKGLIDKILDTLPQDFEKASMRDKAGLLKILTETFGGKREEALEEKKNDQPTFNFVFSDVSIKEKNDGK